MMAKTDAIPCPTESDLLAAARSGNPDAATAAHVTTCPECGTLWEVFLAAIPSVPSAPRTADCLDDNTLAEYMEGVIAPGPRRRAEAHLATCAACTSQLAALHSLLESPTRESVPQLALAWLRDGLRTLDAISAPFRSVELALAPVLRDTTGEAQLAWDIDSEAGPVRVVVQHESARRATLRITVPPRAAARCRVLLWAGGDLLEAQTRHPGDVAEFADLALERHEVTVELGDTDLRFDVDLRSDEPEARA